MILWYSLDPSKIGFDKASKICEMRIFSEDLVPQNKQDWAWGLLGMMNIPPYLFSYHSMAPQHLIKLWETGLFLLSFSKNGNYYLLLRLSL